MSVWTRRMYVPGSALAASALAVVTLGGVFAAPLAALVALAALALPAHSLTHALVGPLIVGAGIWLGLAILAAHARKPIATWRRRARRLARRDVDA